MSEAFIDLPIIGNIVKKRLIGKYTREMKKPVSDYVEAKSELMQAEMGILPPFVTINLSEYRSLTEKINSSKRKVKSSLEKIFIAKREYSSYDSKPFGRREWRFGWFDLYGCHRLDPRDALNMFVEEVLDTYAERRTLHMKDKNVFNFPHVDTAHEILSDPKNFISYYDNKKPTGEILIPDRLLRIARN